MEYIEAIPRNMRVYGGEGIAAMDHGEPLILAVTIQTHHKPLHKS
jgi:hypothetical protein